MVDSVRRKQLAKLLQAFITCKMTNDQFVEASCEIIPSGRQSRRLHDKVLGAVLEKAWFLYDDIQEHRIYLTGGEREEAKRWILFLQTDLEYEWPVDHFINSGGCLPNILTLGLWGRVVRRSLNKKIDSIGTWHLWPFMRETDYQQALTQAGEQGQVASSEFDPMASRKAAADLLDQYLQSTIDTQHLRHGWPGDIGSDSGTDAIFANCVELLPEGTFGQISDPEMSKRISALVHRCILFLRTDQRYVVGKTVHESVLVPIAATLGLLIFVRFLIMHFPWDSGPVGSTAIFYGPIIVLGFSLVMISRWRIERIRRRKMLGPDRLLRWPFPEDSV